MDFKSLIECVINGDSVGTATAPDTVAKWVFVSHAWNSGASTVANVQLWDLEKAYIGNDFALDDISMTVVPLPGAVVLGSMGMGFAAGCLRRRRARS